MARPRNHGKHVSAAVDSLVKSIESLLGSLQTAVAAGAARTGAAGRALVADVRGGAHVRTPGQRGPGKNNPKLKAAIKASWARMTPAEKKARIKKMLAGRGLKPKKT